MKKQITKHHAYTRRLMTYAALSAALNGCALKRQMFYAPSDKEKQAAEQARIEQERREREIRDMETIMAETRASIAERLENLLRQEVQSG